MRIRPLLLVDFHSSTLSGGNRRTYEILRLAKSEGIDYVVLTDRQSCENATKMFPSYLDVLSNYKVYVKNVARESPLIPGLRQAVTYMGIIDSGLKASRVAREENVDLIVGSEELNSLLTSWIAGRYCGKPWTAVFQPTSDTLQPTSSIGALNVTNVLRFVSKKPSTTGLQLLSRIGVAAELLTLLDVAEKSLMLPVSLSVEEDLRFLNPRIRFRVIEPGNGISTEKFATKSNVNKKYNAVFFGRLVPEKGLYDLPIIWKCIKKSFSDATLAVAGITEEQEHVNRFLRTIKKYDLERNIVFLGELEESALMDLVRSAELTLYPSLVDSFSLVTLESLACGVPVVAYDIAAIRHNFGKCGAVLRCRIKDHRQMAEKSLSLLKDKNMRIMLSKQAKEYSTRYDWRNAVKAEKEAYFEVIKHFD